MKNLLFVLFVFSSIASQVHATDACHESDQYNQGVCQLENGQVNIAFKTLSIAAKEGHNGAQLVLSDMYSEGKGTKKNIEKAIFFAKKAYLSDARGAAKRIAFLYKKKNDLLQYLGWLTIAANNADAWSMVLLGDFYNKDFKEGNYHISQFWYDKAIKISLLETTIDKLHPTMISDVEKKQEILQKRKESFFEKIE